MQLLAQLSTLIINTDLICIELLLFQPHQLIRSWSNQHVTKNSSFVVLGRREGVRLGRSRRVSYALQRELRGAFESNIGSKDWGITETNTPPQNTPYFLITRQ